MPSVNVQPQRIEPGVSSTGLRAFCERCNEPHDPALHFDRFQFDRAGLYPNMNMGDPSIRAGFEC